MVGDLDALPLLVLADGGTRERLGFWRLGLLGHFLGLVLRSL